VKPATAPPAYLIESVDRALHVLELLSDERSTTLTGISRVLEVSPSTAHRLLTTLAHRDFVRQDPHTRAYQPGRALLEIGLAAAGSLDVRRLARPELEALAARLEETVHLVRLDGDHVLFLDTVESARAARVTDRTGVSLPAHCAASGKVLLAQLDVEALRALLPDPLPAVTPHTCTSRTALERELAEVRVRGYAVNQGESERGLSAVAVPIPVPKHSHALSLTASVPSEHLEPAAIGELAAATRVAALRLGERLAQ
jgi:DNA-binding IclR family transcriptional regulator